MIHKIQNNEDYTPLSLLQIVGGRRFQRLTLPSERNPAQQTRSEEACKNNQEQAEHLSSNATKSIRLLLRSLDVVTIVDSIL